MANTVQGHRESAGVSSPTASPEWALRRPAAGSPAISRPSNLVLVACVLIAVWLVFVPLAALFYTAFTEDTGFGPGPFSLENFVEAYSSWHILRAVPQLADLCRRHRAGHLRAWAGWSPGWSSAPTRPGPPVPHAGAALVRDPGPADGDGLDLRAQPQYRLGQCADEIDVRPAQAPFNIYSMAGMIWALSSHYFPLAYLALGPALRVLDVRMEEAGLVSGGRYWQVLPKITLPLLRPAILSTVLLLFVLGMSSYEVPRLIGRPARIDVFTTDIQAATPGAARVRRRERARAHAARASASSRCSSIAAPPATPRPSRPSPARATCRPGSSSAAGAGRWRSAICLMFVVSLGLPLFTLVWQSFFRNLAQPFIGSTAPASRWRTTSSSCTIRSSSMR